MTAVETVMDMIKRALEGSYNLLDFSFDVQDYLALNDDKLSDENIKLTDWLQEDLPFVADELDMSNTKPFIDKVQTIYNKALTLI